MAFLRATVTIGLLACSARATWPQDVDVGSFVATEKVYALQAALNNIGPNGSQVPGAKAGFVIASPSKQDPDYFYSWLRDSALTIKTVIDEFTFNNQYLQSYIEDYIKAQAVLQTVTNPSGTLLGSGAGLGEPKFLPDGSRFNAQWGRPQRDGPALRAIAIIAYSNYLIGKGQTERVKSEIWPIISNDLSYVGQYWNQTTFDLWEEVEGASFFTTQNQARSLVEGAKLASTLGVTCTGCDQAPAVLCFLNQGYWNGKYFTANVQLKYKNTRSGVDANTVIGPISVFDSEARCDSLTLQPCHSKVLANFKVFVDAFRDPAVYPINKGIPSTGAVAVGRYTEDVYQGGNPWYLITLAAAELLYDAVAQWTHQEAVTVDDTSLAFFHDIYPAATAGATYRSCDKAFGEIIKAATAYADAFVAVVQHYTPPDGFLAEQFRKTLPGDPVSAHNLTWSHAAFVTMSHRRGKQYPTPGWTAAVPSQVPTTCAASSTPGHYAPATAAGAPAVTEKCTSTVLFSLNATTYYGENIFLTGSSADLGKWDVTNAPALTASNYSKLSSLVAFLKKMLVKKANADSDAAAEHPFWFADVAMTAGETVTYTYVRLQNCKQPNIWETVNRTLTVPPCVEGSTAIVAQKDDAWTGPVGKNGNC